MDIQVTITGEDSLCTLPVPDGGPYRAGPHVNVMCLGRLCKTSARAKFDRSRNGDETACLAVSMRRGPASPCVEKQGARSCFGAVGCPCRRRAD